MSFLSILRTFFEMKINRSVLMVWSICSIPSPISISYVHVIPLFSHCCCPFPFFVFLVSPSSVPLNPLLPCLGRPRLNFLCSVISKNQKSIRKAIDYLEFGEGVEFFQNVTYICILYHWYCLYVIYKSFSCNEKSLARLDPCLRLIFWQSCEKNGSSRTLCKQSGLDGHHTTLVEADPYKYAASDSDLSLTPELFYFMLGLSV